MRSLENNIKEKVSTCKGYYLYVFRLNSEQKILVGKLGYMFFKRGNYIYLGSSFLERGIFQRVSRHLRKEKKKHWHIDYLTTLEDSEPVEVLWICCDKKGREPDIASCLEKTGLTVIKGFGSSDVGSKGHLFFFGERSFSVEERLKLMKCLQICHS